MGTERQIVYGDGNKTVNVPSAYFAECLAATPDLKSHDSGDVFARYLSGTMHEGWIVYALNDKNAQIGAKASSEALLQLFSRKEDFAKLLPPKKPKR